MSKITNYVKDNKYNLSISVENLNNMNSVTILGYLNLV